MAKAKDALKTLLNAQPPERKLSPEWIDKEPSLSDFQLEGKDINEIYREYTKFMNNQEIRINSLEKQRPVKVKTKFLPEKTRESWISWGLAIAALGYGIFAGEHRNWIILGALIAAALVFFIIYFRKVNAGDREYRQAIAEIDRQISEIRSETCEQKEDYNHLVKYAEALYDFQAWKRRKDLSFWKNATKDEIVKELVSMNNSYGLPSAAVNNGYVSLTYDNPNGRDFALYVSHKGALTKKDVIQFEQEAHDENLHAGTIIALKGIQADAKAECEEDDIEIWTMEDLIHFEENIEREIS